MSETQFRVGKIIEGEADRDAIHIAVVPVTLVSTQKYDSFQPGCVLKLLAGTTDQAGSMPNEGYGEDRGDGILDPFVTNDYRRGLKAGDRVWMFLYPNTVHGMRHHWTHPRFDAPEQLSEAQVWLRRFADRWGMNYDTMLEEAQDNGGSLLAVGRDLHGKSELDDGEEVDFWRHLQTVTGRSFDAEHRESICWTCTC